MKKQILAITLLAFLGSMSMNQSHGLSDEFKEKAIRISAGLACLAVALCKIENSKTTSFKHKNLIDEIDENKFKKILEENPEQLKDLMRLGKDSNLVEDLLSKDKKRKEAAIKFLLNQFNKLKESESASFNYSSTSVYETKDPMRTILTITGLSLICNSLLYGCCAALLLK